jgi:flagellar biosynthesis protein FliR
MRQKIFANLPQVTDVFTSLLRRLLDYERNSSNSQQQQQQLGDLLQDFVCLLVFFSFSFTLSLFLIIFQSISCLISTNRLILTLNNDVL